MNSFTKENKIFLTILIVLSIAMGAILIKIVQLLTGEERLLKLATAVISECELTLPRNKTCELLAKPKN